MQKISFYNSKQETIVGLLDINNKKSDTITLIIHGFASYKQSISQQVIMDELKKRKMNYLSIDFDDIGESSGRFETSTVQDYVNTTEHALLFLKKEGFTEIQLVGSSFGGYIALIVAERHPELKRLLLKCPVPNFIRHMKRRAGLLGILTIHLRGWFPKTSSKGTFHKVSAKKIWSTKEYNMFVRAKNITVPTLILHGTKDEMIPYQDAILLEKNMPSAKLKLVKDANHRLRVNNSYAEHVKYAGDFLEKGIIPS